MNVEIMEEQLYGQICKRILRPGMRRIAMTYSVSNSILYDTLHDCDMPDFVIDWDRDTERQKSYLRIGRILERLNLVDTVDASEDSVFTTKPKVFDAGMYAAMKSSYETIIDEIGDRVLFEIPAARYMDALEIDGRPKLSFVEMALLSSLYMALRGPAVDKINQPLNTVNQVKRGKPRVKKILDALHSTELQQSLIRAVFDLLLEGIKGEFEVVKGEYMQTYEFVEFIEYFFGKICPLAERVALSLEPRRDKDRNVKECEYAVAEKVGSVVKNYVDGVIRATEVLLECLPEVACVKRLES